MLKRTIKFQAHGKYLYMNVPKIIAEEMNIQKGDIARIEIKNKAELKIKVERNPLWHDSQEWEK